MLAAQSFEEILCHICQSMPDQRYMIEVELVMRKMWSELPLGFMRGWRSNVTAGLCWLENSTLPTLAGMPD